MKEKQNEQEKQRKKEVELKAKEIIDRIQPRP
jgi:hypothetical protein